MCVQVADLIKLTLHFFAKGAFSGAIGFNQGLNSWDMSSATSLFGMFYFASGFNGDVSRWQVSMVANFSVSM